MLPCTARSVAFKLQNLYHHLTGIWRRGCVVGGLKVVCKTTLPATRTMLAVAHPYLQHCDVIIWDGHNLYICYYVGTGTWWYHISMGVEEQCPKGVVIVITEAKRYGYRSKGHFLGVVLDHTLRVRLLSTFHCMPSICHLCLHVWGL